MRWDKRLSRQYAEGYRQGLTATSLGRYTNASEQEPVVDSMNLSTDALLLDAGCGTGRFLANATPGQHFVGMDLSIEMLRVARDDLKRGSFVVGEMEKLPFRDGAFDEVITVRVLQHVRDQEQAVRECTRVCKKSGDVIVLSYNAWSLLALYKGIRQSWIGSFVASRLSFVPVLRSVFGTWSFDYDNYCSAPELESMFQRVGLQPVEQKGATIGMPWLFQYSQLAWILEALAPGLLETYFAAARRIERPISTMFPFKLIMDKVMLKGRPVGAHPA